MSHDTKSVYASQTQLLESLRDIWPQQKGLAALLFQDDLFYRLRRLEAMAEEDGNVDEAAGFLPDYFPEWSGETPEYAAAWLSIESEVRLGETEPLDHFEDEICAWCEDMIPESIAFFDAALDTGTLDERWLHAAEALLAAEQPVRVVEEEVAEVHAVEEAAATEAADESPPAAAASVIELAPEPPRARPTRRRRIGLPLTPSRVRRIVRTTRRHPHNTRN